MNRTENDLPHRVKTCLPTLVQFNAGSAGHTAERIVLYMRGQERATDGDFTSN